MHMSVRRLILLVGAAIALVTAAMAPAGAQVPSATTYHGVFTGVSYDSCAGGDPAVPVVTGNWNISRLGSSAATVTVNIVINGKHHVSFGAPLAQITAGSSTVTVQLPTLAGPLTIDLTGDTLTYRIAPYNYDGLSCDAVTYTGVLVR
jgi:urease alpha subunit